MRQRKDWTFHEGATAIGNGIDFYVNDCDVLTVEITGVDVTTSTILFQGIMMSGAAYTIRGIRQSDFTIATQSIAIDECWQFDTTGVKAVRMEISELTGVGATLTVKGMAVSING